MLIRSLLIAAGTWAAFLVVAGLLHLVPRLGPAGRKLSDALCRAPLLDVLVVYFTVAPLVVGPILGGWLGLLASVLGAIAAMLTWQTIHELAHPADRDGPRLIKSCNKLVGPVRNYTAVWWTAWVLPGFSIVRAGELFVYPMLTWTVGLPKYKSGDWVNVSRHKFQGLIGHDLIWCLYCDWMTGVWSLGTEMLRNVESFWCPIRFRSDKKCANCATDFPDLENGWVDADATMSDVVRRHNQMYPPEQYPRAWFGHPVRLTVKGKALRDLPEPISV